MDAGIGAGGGEGEGISETAGGGDKLEPFDVEAEGRVSGFTTRVSSFTEAGVDQFGTVFELDIFFVCRFG